MYYYIAEPVTAQAEQRRLDEIQALLSQLGISGEFAVASPARSVEDHLGLAFSRGFTTIVGIGSDALISRVVGVMIGQRYDKAVLGAIPYQTNQAIAQMIGASGLRQIADALRQRQTIDIDVLQLGRRQAIITEAAAHLAAESEFHLRYEDVLAQGLYTDMTLKPNGEIRLWQTKKDSSSNLFGKLFSSTKASDISLTRLQLDHFEFASQEVCSLTIGGEVVAQSPFEAKRRKKALKLIVNRATITPVKDQID